MGDQTAGEWDPERSDDVPADLLAHPYRRALLRFRRWGEGPFHLADVARDVAGETGRVAGVDRVDGAGGDGGPTARSVYVALYHVHAPRLAAAGVLSFDPGERLVSFPRSAAGAERR